MALPPDTTAAIGRLLADRAGLDLPAWMIEARAAARMALAGVDAAGYLARLAGAQGDAELAALIEAVRVGESRLFRHRAQVDAVAEVVAPALRARGARPVRVWSAGCSTGEEPYTLALVLARALPGSAITIHATDISDDALAIARAHTYPRAALAHVPPAYRDGVITDGEAVRIAPAVAGLVRFERANLLDGATPRGCDLVWCRNVLIYFTADARRRAIERLVAATAPGGFLFVGYSESLRDVEGLDALRTRDAAYYVRRNPSAAPRSRPPTWPTAPRPRAAPDTAPPPETAPLSTAAPAETAPPPETAAAPGTPADDVLALQGTPAPADLAAELSARLASPRLRSLTIDLDGAALLEDGLAPVLRRAEAAARAAGVALEVRATRAGARRWLARHALEGAGA